MLTLRRAEYLHFGTRKGSISPVDHDAILTAMRAGDADAAGKLARDNWGTLAAE